MQHLLDRCLRRLPLLLAAGAATQLTLAGAPALAQSYCYQVAAFTSPNLMRCQAIGQDYIGRTIWQCC